MLRSVDPFRTAAVGTMLLALVACSARRPMGEARPPSSGVRIANLPTTSSDNLARLERLTAARRAGTGDYVLGEGDVLAIRAVGMDDLTQRVRVAADGNVTLPLLGAVPVAGRTLAEAQQDLRTRLGTYMYHPEVSVFVDENRSQQIGVVGAVQRPGLVTLTAEHTTVLDALSAAGGMTTEAGGRIYLVPAARAGAVEACSGPCDTTAAAPPAEPIMLDVKEIGQTAQTQFYALPVRAGDVLMVPGAGEFVLSGWVAKPGSYPVKTALTIRGAIATGGGLSFAANATRVRVHRMSPSGATDTEMIDVDAISADRAPDVFVHDGDVIEVPSSAPKLAAYGVYKTFTDVVRVGAGLSIP